MCSLPLPASSWQVHYFGSLPIAGRRREVLKWTLTGLDSQSGFGLPYPVNETGTANTTKILR